MSINQREVAVYALVDITSGGGYNNIVLRKTLAKNNAMSSVDKAFVTEVVNGVLRNMMFLDHVIDSVSKTPTTKMKPFILNLLRVGAYQLHFMDKVPPSAACNECVNIAKQRGFKNLAPFVNGVLRNINRQKANVTLPEQQAFPGKYLSVRFSYPLWLIDYWLEFLSFDTVLAMVSANSKRPAVTVAVNNIKTDKAALVRSLASSAVQAEAVPGFENALALSHTSDITALQAFADGMFFVMDRGAMFAVEMADIKQGQVVVDVCAAPGGKSFYAAAKVGETGKVMAFDVHEHKIQLMNDTKTRLCADSVCADIGDATKFNPEFENVADVVIVDAPCSGFGLVRKKPDIKYTKTMQDVGELAKLQKQILANCSRYVKPGGTLLYCTCTVSKHENAEVVDWFLQNHGFKLEKAVDLLPGVVQSLKSNKEQTATYDGDGFFAAKLIREEV